MFCDCCASCRYKSCRALRARRGNWSLLKCPNSNFVITPYVILQDVEMFRQVVADADARQNELLEENGKLRNLLYDVQMKMTEFIENQTKTKYKMTPQRNMNVDPEFIGIEVGYWLFV